MVKHIGCWGFGGGDKVLGVNSEHRTECLCWILVGVVSTRWDHRGNNKRALEWVVNVEVLKITVIAAG